jgi:8-oxo-dGTP pyrophosphatase MutT (NUDIX family)
MTSLGAGIILTRGDRVLLLKAVDSGIWSFPKGHMESEDMGNLFFTAIREVFEETGYVYGRHYLVGESRRLDKRLYWMARPCPWLPDPVLRPKEHQQWRWVTKEDICWMNVNKGVKKWSQTK